MKNLSEEIRTKAIEIANSLLKEKNEMEEKILIATAISRAKDWAANRSQKKETVSKNSKVKDTKKQGEDRHAVPSGEKIWAAKETVVKPLTKETKKAKAGIAIQDRVGNIERKNSFRHRKKSKQKNDPFN